MQLEVIESRVSHGMIQLEVLRGKRSDLRMKFFLDLQLQANRSKKKGGKGLQLRGINNRFRESTRRKKLGLPPLVPGAPGLHCSPTVESKESVGMELLARLHVPPRCL